MLHSIVVLVRVLLGLFLGVAAVVCVAIGLYFMTGLHTKLLGGGALLAVAFFLFAAALFAASRNVLVTTLRIPSTT